MSDVLYVAVPILSVAVLLLVLRGVRLVDTEGRPIRLWIQRRMWLAPALFFLTFAAGDFVILLIDGGIVKHLVLIVPALVAGGWLMYKAKSTK